MSDARSFYDFAIGEGLTPSLTTTVLIFLVKKSTMKLSGVLRICEKNF